jgi:hypothetical protein
VTWAQGSESLIVHGESKQQLDSEENGSGRSDTNQQC